MDDRPVVFDDDNPEWTEADFARARPASELPPHILAAFPKTRGAQAAPTKEQVSIRLDRDVLALFRQTGRGWQGRLNAALRKAAGLQRSS